MYKLLPSHFDDSSLSVKESITATNWTNLAISSLEKFFRKEFSSLDVANSEMKLMIRRVLQKQDYNTTCLNESIKVLTEND